MNGTYTPTPEGKENKKKGNPKGFVPAVTSNLEPPVSALPPPTKSTSATTATPALPPSTEKIS